MPSCRFRGPSACRSAMRQGASACATSHRRTMCRRSLVPRWTGTRSHRATRLLRRDLLTPSRIGALAAVGCADVEVFARPRVAILSTGNEVVEPGQALAPGQIYDVNRFTLAAIVSAHGGVPDVHAAAHDTLDALTAAVDRCS